MVGAALKRKRKDITLSTKTAAKTKEEALQELDTSLKDAGNRPCGYLVPARQEFSRRGHRRSDRGAAVAKKAGKIRFAGVSTHNGQKELLPFLARNPNIDVILTAYNFTMEPFMERGHRRGGQGRQGHRGDEGDGRHGARRLQPGDPNLKRLQAGRHAGGPQVGLRNPNVGTTIPSMTDMDQLDENLKATANPFSAADREDPDRASGAHPLRCIAACAASATARAARACRWPTCCAS
jgi:hypothetical protein